MPKNDVAINLLKTKLDNPTADDAELVQIMRLKGYAELEINRALQAYQHFSSSSENRAYQFANKSVKKHRGNIWIAKELSRQAVTEDVINQIIAELPCELQRAKSALQRHDRFEAQKANAVAKAAAYLHSRGFSTQVAWLAAESSLEKM